MQASRGPGGRADAPYPGRCSATTVVRLSMPGRTARHTSGPVAQAGLEHHRRRAMAAALHRRRRRAAEQRAEQHQATQRGDGGAQRRVEPDAHAREAEPRPQHGDAPHERVAGCAERERAHDEHGPFERRRPAQRKQELGQQDDQGLVQQINRKHRLGERPTPGVVTVEVAAREAACGGERTPLHRGD